jgi:hypothetical protein
MGSLLKLQNKRALSSEGHTKMDKRMVNFKCFKRERTHQNYKIGSMEESNTTNEIIHLIFSVVFFSHNSLIF